MATITITLADDRLARLQEVAARFSLTPEEVVRLSVEQLLAQPDEAFQNAADYVLRKNADLYRRLA